MAFATAKSPVKRNGKSDLNNTQFLSDLESTARKQRLRLAEFITRYRNVFAANALTKARAESLKHRLARSKAARIVRSGTR